jgi:dolichol-phosphate mannosyltransferase
MQPRGPETPGQTMRVPELAIVVPSFNERENISRLIAAVAAALEGVEWEIVIVDDDSPDGTYHAILEAARKNPRVRGLRRVGRKGLASAVIEGILASSAPIVAVMDADLQHDEQVLRDMLERIAAGADLVVGTRYAGEGGVGSWSEDRVRMSRLATRIGRFLIGDRTSDPMSGFFMARRHVVNNCVHDLSQQGYKILLDIIASAPSSIVIAEVPYTFRHRQRGESKLDVMVLAEFFFLIVEKLTGGLIPPRFVLFAMVGSLGLLVHLAVLNAVALADTSFVIAQAVATFVAMIFNFILNNHVTYRDRRLTGASWFAGLALFIVTCSFGAIANLSVASLAQQEIGYWNLSGLIGAVMGAVFNYGVSSNLVWGQRRARHRAPEIT